MCKRGDIYVCFENISNVKKKHRLQGVRIWQVLRVSSAPVFINRSPASFLPAVFVIFNLNFLRRKRTNLPCETVCRYGHVFKHVCLYECRWAARSFSPFRRVHTWECGCTLYLYRYVWPMHRSKFWWECAGVWERQSEVELELSFRSRVSAVVFVFASVYL